MRVSPPSPAASADAHQAPAEAGTFAPDLHDVRHLRLKAVLFGVWVAVSFGATYCARDLQAFVWAGWPLGYWVAAQGAVLAFIAIVAVYCIAMNWYERADAAQAAAAPEHPPGTHPHG